MGSPHLLASSASFSVVMRKRSRLLSSGCSAYSYDIASTTTRHDR